MAGEGEGEWGGGTRAAESGVACTTLTRTGLRWSWWRFGMEAWKAFRRWGCGGVEGGWGALFWVQKRSCVLGGFVLFVFFYRAGSCLCVTNFWFNIGVSQFPPSGPLSEEGFSICTHACLFLCFGAQKKMLSFLLPQAFILVCCAT